MNQINPYQLQALSESLLELYSPVNQAGLPEHFFKVLRKVVPSSVYSYCEEPASGFRDLHHQYAVQAGGLPENVVVEAPAALPLEGIATQASPLQSVDEICERLATESANHSAKLMLRVTVRDQLRKVGAPEIGGAASQSPEWVLTISLQRISTDFSEAERMSLEFLRPHFRQVYTLCKAAESLKQASENGERGVLIVRRDGELQFLNLKAEMLLAKYGQGEEREGHLLPKAIRNWIRQLERQAHDHRPGALTTAPLQIERFTERLIVRLESNPNATEYRLTLSEEGAGLSAKPLEDLGLTPREAEVLLWVSQGKSNGEISLILGVKERTVGKHLENIFVKLHVENRTTAAFVALEQLRRAG